MSLGPGTRLGPYEILSAIGAGGMGEVYAARDPRLGRSVAIKVLPTTFSADPERLARFEQEARAAAALNHPNILAVYDIGTHLCPEPSRTATSPTRLPVPSWAGGCRSPSCRWHLGPSGRPSGSALVSPLPPIGVKKLTPLGRTKRRDSGAEEGREHG